MSSTSNDPRSIDFSYKKYSLEQLDNWVNDALNCEDLTPEDIYNTIVSVVDESVEYHKKYLTKSIELLSLLKGHRQVDFDYTATGEKFPAVTEATDKDWVDFWEENYYPEESHQYTEEELNAMCNAAADKEKCREYNLREIEYYNKRAELDAQSKKKTYLLPVEKTIIDGEEEFYVTFPDDLLKAANLKPGDDIEWVDLKDGSYQIRKVTKPLSMDEC